MAPPAPVAHRLVPSSGSTAISTVSAPSRIAPFYRGANWPRVFDFLADQRGGRTVVRLADRESGLSARTIARRLSSVSGLYAYLVARGDTPVQVNPVPRGLLTRRPFRAPHHTLSNAALVGGGSPPRPGGTRPERSRSGLSLRWRRRSGSPCRTRWRAMEPAVAAIPVPGMCW